MPTYIQTQNTWLDAFISADKKKYTHAHTYTRTYINLIVHKCINMYVHIAINIYIHIHIHANGTYCCSTWTTKSYPRAHTNPHKQTHVLIYQYILIRNCTHNSWLHLHLQYLLRLHLDNNRIEDEGMQVLADAFIKDRCIHQGWFRPMPQNSVVSNSHKVTTQITKTAKCTKKMSIKLNFEKFCRLSKNCITDDGAASFGEALQTSLECLNEISLYRYPLPLSQLPPVSSAHLSSATSLVFCDRRIYWSIYDSFTYVDASWHRYEWVVSRMIHIPPHMHESWHLVTSFVLIPIFPATNSRSKAKHCCVKSLQARHWYCVFKDAKVSWALRWWEKEYVIIIYMIT